MGNMIVICTVILITDGFAVIVQVEIVKNLMMRVVITLGWRKSPLTTILIVKRIKNQILEINMAY